VAGWLVAGRKGTAVADKRPVGYEVHQLKQLTDLRDAGVITDEVFEEQRALLLAQSVARTSASARTHGPAGHTTVVAMLVLLTFLVVVLSLLVAFHLY